MPTRRMATRARLLSHRSTWAALAWTMTAAQAARRLAMEGTPDAARLPPPPHDASTRPVVAAALRRFRASCLVRSLVLQRFDAAHGRPRDLVIGVRTADGFAAHAWLDGEPAPPAAEAFVELVRLPGPAAGH